MDKTGDKSDPLFNSGSTKAAKSAAKTGVADIALKAKLTNLELGKTKLETRMRKIEDMKNREISKLRGDLTKTQRAGSGLKFENKILELKRMNKRSVDEVKVVSVEAKKLKQELGTQKNRKDELNRQLAKNRNDAKCHS